MSEDGLYYVAIDDMKLSGSMFTDATLVLLCRIGYLWKNSNMPPEHGRYRICIECLADTRMINDPEQVCPACKGFGRMDLDS